MGKYTNAWFHHDCANDGTCGQSITDFRIGDSDIFFYDSDGTVIAQIPKLPNGNSLYHNNLYKTAQSKNFSENTKYVGLQDVLPNQFNFEYGKLNCVIHYDDVSQREKDQIKFDIQNAYEAYKAKFCINSDTQVTVHTYIFNNSDDYRRYGTLVPRFSEGQSLLNTSHGVTNGESVLLYKYVNTDKTLAHEFGHVFQKKLSEAKVKGLEDVNSELIANAIGLEVEEKNYKAICKQIGVDEYMGVDEYEDHGWMFKFKYKGINYDIQHKGYLLVVKEKLQLIQDIKKNFHESLVSEYYRLNKEPLSQNTTVTMSMNKNKEPEEDMSRSKSEEDVDEVDHTEGKEAKEDISRSKPKQDVDEVDPKPGKEPEPESAEEDTQQPSNFLSNIFSAIKSVIDSISSFFLWLFWSKEEKSDESTQQPSADDLSLLKPDVDELGHDVRDHLSDHYHSPDEFM